MNLPLHSSEEIFHRLLDESSALLAAPESAGIAIPDDELHREIIVPLLPAMLGDKAIRGHWSEQHATGFVARIGRHFENGDPAPRWTPGDFEIHVTASYSAGADARALADTLLSEDSLRDMTAALMNQLLDALWPSLAPAPAAPVPAIEIPPVEIPAAEIPTPVAAPEIPAPIEVSAAEEIPEPLLPAIEFPEPSLSTETPPEPESEPAREIPPAQIFEVSRLPSRALIRALCRKLDAAALQRRVVANSTRPGTSASIVARRILTPSFRNMRTIENRRELRGGHLGVRWQA